MVVTAIVVVCVIVVFYVWAKRSRTRFNAEETARMRAKSRRRWSEWLDDDKKKTAERQHDETWVEYQERKRR